MSYEFRKSMVAGQWAEVFCSERLENQAMHIFLWQCEYNEVAVEDVLDEIARIADR